jgi:hypothetical protein
LAHQNLYLPELGHDLLRLVVLLRHLDPLNYTAELT